MASPCNDVCLENLLFVSMSGGSRIGSACTKISLWWLSLLDDTSTSVSSRLLLRLSRRNRVRDNGNVIKESRNRCFNIDNR